MVLREGIQIFGGLMILQHNLLSDTIRQGSEHSTGSPFARFQALLPPRLGV